MVDQVEDQIVPSDGVKRESILNKAGLKGTHSKCKCKNKEVSTA